MDKSQQDELLVAFKNQYGKVARIEINGVKVYLKPLDFNDWAEIPREMKMSIINEVVDYEVTDKGINKYIIPSILDPIPLPKEIRTKAVNMNLIATTVLNITDFDNHNLMIERYKKALSRQMLLSSDIKRQLITAFGIQVLDVMKGKGVDDVVELLAISEWMTESQGAFARAVGRDDVVPVNQHGKINFKELMSRMNEWLYDEPVTEKKPNTISNIKPEKEQPKQEQRPVFDPIESTRPKSHLEEELHKQEHQQTGVKTISDIKDTKPKEAPKQDIRNLREPKLYNNGEELDPVMAKRNKIEFNGNLINIWNESQVKLYEQIQSDLENPNRFKTSNKLGSDLVAEDLKVNENFDDE